MPVVRNEGHDGTVLAMCAGIGQTPIISSRTTRVLYRTMVRITPITLLYRSRSARIIHRLTLQDYQNHPAPLIVRLDIILERFVSWGPTSGLSERRCDSLEDQEWAGSSVG